MHSRETIKMAIIYAAQGNESDSSIMGCVETSENYQIFLKQLGWKIDLQTHPDFYGGLDKVWTSEALYYCSSTIEVIFHDATMMPNEESDVKFLKKIRHIGNDHVHIVWNEHYRDYRKVISGDFGNVSIVITPLPSNLFAIDILTTEKVFSASLCHR